MALDHHIWYPYSPAISQHSRLSGKPVLGMFGCFFCFFFLIYYNYYFICAEAEEAEEKTLTEVKSVQKDVAFVLPESDLVPSPAIYYSYLLPDREEEKDGK